MGSLGLSCLITQVIFFLEKQKSKLWMETDGYSEDREDGKKLEENGV